MTISDFILNPNELKNINAASVRKAAIESFIPGIKNYSAQELAVLYAFCVTDFKMYEALVAFYWKSLGNSYKDLEQYQNTGAFVAEPDTKTKFAADIVNACNRANEFYNAVITEMKNSFDIVKGKWGKGDRYEIKSDSPLAKLVEDKTDERSASLYSAREVVAYLATYLAVENGLVDGIVTSEQSKQDTLTYLFNGLVEPKNGGILNALKKYTNAYNNQKDEMMDVFTIREVASELAKQQIEKINATSAIKIDSDVAKNFYNCVMLNMIQTMASPDFKDISVALDEGKSNYRVFYIDEKGRVVFREDVKNYTTAAEADNAFRSNGAHDTDLLGAIKYYDKQMLKDEKDKTIDNFEDGAWLCIANLLMIEFAGLEGKNKERLQQAFAIPLAQCLDRVESPEKRLEIVKKAVKKVEELGLPYTRAIELADEDAAAADPTSARMAGLVAARSTDKSAEVKAPRSPLNDYKKYMHQAMSDAYKGIVKKKDRDKVCKIFMIMQGGLAFKVKNKGIVLEGNKDAEKEFTVFAQKEAEIEGTIALKKAQKQREKTIEKYKLTEEEQEAIKIVFGDISDKAEKLKGYRELSKADKLKLIEEAGLTKEEAEKVANAARDEVLPIV